MLAEHVTDVGKESGHRHVLRVLVRDADVAYEHESACRVLQGLVPSHFFASAFGDDLYLHFGGILRKNFDAVGIEHSEAQGIALSVPSQCGDPDGLCPLVVGDGDGGVGQQLNLLFKEFRFFLLVGRPSASFLSAEHAVDLLEPFRMVVEGFEVQLSVGRCIAAVGDGVAHAASVGEFRAALPVVGGGVFDIRCNPVEDGNLVDGDVPRDVGLLLVRQRCSEVEEAGAYGIFPGFVLCGVEVLVERNVGLLDFGVRARGEVEVDLFGRIPTQREVAVPKEVAGKAQRQRSVVELFHVALLEFVVGACDVGIEGNALWQIADTEFLGKAQPRRFSLDEPFEWFHGLHGRTVGVGEVSAPVFVAFPCSGFAGGIPQ